jgi:hypothetical protein
VTIGIVEERLDAFLEAERSKILMLTGGWGAGKTHQWKQALQRSESSDDRPRYAYVSLFGLNNLAEVRKRVAEEMVATFKIPDSAGVLGDMIDEGGWKLKPLQIVKLLPVIPYLGKLEGLANELSFSSVKNAVICFDDLERGGNGLRLADVFGFASFLKEERNCKVILISNQEKLSGDKKNDLQIYLEKVVDEIVHFAPTPDEACKIALGETSNHARSLLHERIRELGVSNIRVISRLGNMATELESQMKTLNERVLKEAIQALALFGVAHFIPSNSFPTVNYLMELGDNLGRYFRDAIKEEDKTEEDRKQESWEALLDRYGYSATSPLDAEIGRAVQRGYIDREALFYVALQLSAEFETEKLLTTYRNAWNKFWNSLNGEGQALLQELRKVTTECLGVIGVSDLSAAYEVFVQAGQQDEANELLDLFIEVSQDRPEVFKQANGSFSQEYSVEVVDRIRAECNRHNAPPSFEEALDRIDFDRGWNPEDIRFVSKAVPADIERLLLNSEGQQFRARLRSLLQIGKLQDAQEDAKRVSEQTLEFLKRLANEDPITAIRMRQYIPEGGS